MTATHVYTPLCKLVACLISRVVLREGILSTWTSEPWNLHFQVGSGIKPLIVALQCRLEFALPAIQNDGFANGPFTVGRAVRKRNEKKNTVFTLSWVDHTSMIVNPPPPPYPIPTSPENEIDHFQCSFAKKLSLVSCFHHDGAPWGVLAESGVKDLL